ncbi:hypothetical protein LJR231_004401 [Phyllobacterium sp. LjRoot231]|uniref:hypothetical protein n=1 Tax=Phyllobacterium sp. LjRoot231 TaxID=3342289 RepID=UPI003ECF86FC
MNAISQQPEDEIDEALAYHQGDVRATIAALLAEREFLLREIEYASLAMSYGFARGWKPGLGSGRDMTAR